MALPLASAVASEKATGSAPVELAPYVVTGAAPLSPFESTLDPGMAAQPLPAQDGADVIKSIAGMAVIRKGGTSGDPVFRGMAGSRLAIQADGQICLGGCGSRMDPPTAYVFPGAYDRVRLLKGPQTVLNGPGHSAGAVLFERTSAFESVSLPPLINRLTVGSWERRDLSASALARGTHLAGRLDLVHTESGPYEDGSGTSVHSAHRRWSAQPSLEVKIDPKTVLSLSAIRSDGQAAYADRMMDGTLFDRSSLSARVRHVSPEGIIRVLNVEIGVNAVDHVMDNYTLRPFTPSMMMPHPTASNPDRKTVIGRATARIASTNTDWGFTVGTDYQFDRHRERATSHPETLPLNALPRTPTAKFAQVGVFGEAVWEASTEYRFVAGGRLDSWAAKDLRKTIRTGMASTVPNPTAQQTREDLLASGFLRIEKTADDTGIFVGIGHVARFPDYWEAFRYEGLQSVSALRTKPERTTQLDIGTSFKLAAPLTVTLALFASRIDDFILIQSGYLKPGGMMGQRATAVVRNVTAQTWGAEAVAEWQLNPNWTIDGSVAHTHGTNRTDHRPLAQMPPMEATLGIRWHSGPFASGFHLRSVARQNRVAVGQGNTVGQDIAPTDAFTTLALHASWRPNASIEWAVGVDNLFDTLYAEHLSRPGASVAGFLQTERVNEPGRTLWLRLQVTF